MVAPSMRTARRSGAHRLGRGPPGRLRGQLGAQLVQQELAGDYSFPLSVPSSLGSGESHDWVQRRPGGAPGGRYLMKGSAKSDLATNFKLRAVVREFSGGLSEQTDQVALSANTWTEADGRLHLPGDAQATPKMPALHQFRAGTPEAGLGHCPRLPGPIAGAGFVSGFSLWR